LRLNLPHRNGGTGHELVDGGLPRRCGVAQGLQQAGLELGEELPALCLAAGALNLPPQQEPALSPGLQPLVRGTVGIVARVLGFGGLPAVEAGLDVTLEDFCQVMVAVELVLVGDASESLNGVEDGHGQAYLQFRRG
jgi:uncharacterized membrane protein YtjA (UPF0391 family)